jgi:hypothetical protein
MNLPNRDELSLRTVRALPNASRMTLVSRIWCSIQVVAEDVTEHRYCRMSLVVSVCAVCVHVMAGAAWYTHQTHIPCQHRSHR